jgi:hypothetical protein
MILRNDKNDFHRGRGVGVHLPSGQLSGVSDQSIPAPPIISIVRRVGVILRNQQNGETE